MASIGRKRWYGGNPDEMRIRDEEEKLRGKMGKRIGVTKPTLAARKKKRRGRR